jgi:hypothetical protein
MSAAEKRRVRVQGPRKITLIKILFLLIPAALVYLGVLFVPPYWRAYEVRTYLAEQRSQTFSRRSERISWHSVVADARAKIRKGVADILEKPPQQLDVTAQKKDDHIIVQVHWKERIRFVPTKKTKLLEFSDTVRVHAR